MSHSLPLVGEWLFQVSRHTQHSFKHSCVMKLNKQMTCWLPVETEIFNMTTIPSPMPFPLSPPGTLVALLPTTKRSLNGNHAIYLYIVHMTFHAKMQTIVNCNNYTPFSTCSVEFSRLFLFSCYSIYTHGKNGSLKYYKSREIFFKNY